MSIFNVHRIVTENNSYGVTTIDDVVVPPVNQELIDIVGKSLKEVVDYCNQRGWIWQYNKGDNQ